MPENVPSPLRTELQELLLVAAGAVPGALVRWQLADIIQDQHLLVNIVGAGLLGVLMGLPFAPRRQLLLGVGLCGSATTFSAWMLDVVRLLSSAAYVEAIGLVGLTLGCGVGAAGLGLLLGRQLRLPKPPQSPV